MRILNCICFLLITAGLLESSGQRISRDMNVDLLVNQVGYVPHAGKTFVTKGIRSAEFEVINTVTREVVFTGTMRPAPGDFGEYSTGNFSSVTREGHYYIKSDSLRSFPFSISASVYKPVMDMIVGYFSLQRCGASTTGYLSPCHLDDGVRIDNGNHQDVTGGWHDASDLRKWVEATMFAMLSMGKTYEMQLKNGPDSQKVLDELMWGNEYFFKMQEPQGYLMNDIGGTNNRWTDNIIGKEGGELASVKPNAGKSSGSISIFGLNDDRSIRTSAVNMLTQFNFITSEAMMARITRSGDARYADKCIQAAQRCYDWCLKSGKALNITDIGASIQASLEMYKTTKQSAFRDYAISQAAELKKYQAKSKEGGLSGFYYKSIADKEPYMHIWWGYFELMSICDLVEMFPDHKDLPAWKEMISDHARNYLSSLSARNSFGIVPYGLFSKEDPGGNRKIGNYWYRYFMQPELSWWVGINSNLASAGLGLMRASSILKDKSLKALAQRQLDWIIGVNPFNSSTIISVGYNHPVRFVNGNEFKPATPMLPGAVMNGLGGNHDDQPDLILKNNWQESEYWTPMVAYTLWLMAEMTKEG